MENRLSLYNYFAGTGDPEKNYRKDSEMDIPSLLAAQINQSCNMDCRDCYMAEHDCVRGNASELLTTDEWEGVFQEAEKLGIAYMFLVGGEPLMSREVINRAISYANMTFSVFTNGLMLDEEYLRLFDTYRHIRPILRLDGCVWEQAAYKCKGSGSYGSLMSAMNQFMQRTIAYGVYLVVTAANYKVLTANGFLAELVRRGCETVMYMEYDKFCLSDEQRKEVETILVEKQSYFPELRLLFRSNEDIHPARSGSSGQIFFRVTPSGYVESQQSLESKDNNIKKNSLRNILKKGFHI